MQEPKSEFQEAQEKLFAEITGATKEFASRFRNSPIESISTDVHFDGYSSRIEIRFPDGSLSFSA